MSAPFVHLHVHTQYSMLDGAIRVGDLIQRAKEFDMAAVAITDHGAMYGALEFYEKANKAGIKPIVGCEFYVAEHGMLRHDRTAVHPAQDAALVEGVEVAADRLCGDVEP